MKLKEMLEQLFPNGHSCTIENQAIIGTANINNADVTVIGTTEKVSLGPKLAIKLANSVLRTIEHCPQQPIIMLVDTAGQEVSLNAELLGMNRYFGHLIKCLSLARHNQHPLITIVYGSALGGAFIAYGLMADKIYGLADAQIAVMWLDAMSRVTQIPVERLEELSKTSAIFAPGVDNFVKLGCMTKINEQENLHDIVSKVLQQLPVARNWTSLGSERKGRSAAQHVIDKICCCE